MISLHKLPDGSYSLSDVQVYIEYILRKLNETLDTTTPIHIYINRINNR